MGQTTRHLHTRISEHLGISPITRKPSSSPVMSSIFSHLNRHPVQLCPVYSHSANFDDFTILSSFSNTSVLMFTKVFSFLSPNPLLTSKASPFHLTSFNILSVAVFSCVLSVCQYRSVHVMYYRTLSYPSTSLPPCNLIPCLLANGARRRSKRKPGARVTNSARLFILG